MAELVQRHPALGPQMNRLAGNDSAFLLWLVVLIICVLIFLFSFSGRPKKLRIERVVDGGRVLIGMIVGGAVGAAIGNAKGRLGLGAVLGALLGCIGWIIVAVLPKKR